MNVRIRIEPARALPPEACYAPRRRWRAERILDWLGAKCLETLSPEERALVSQP